MSKESFENLKFLSNEQRSDDWHQADDEWISNDSSFKDYCSYSLLPPGLLEKILKQQLGQQSYNVGVDLAGGENGQALQDLLADGALNKALLTTYIDRRSNHTKEIAEIDHIAGDLVSPKTWRKIIDWKRAQAPDGIALIMHRPLGALQDLKPSTYVGGTYLLLDMLRSGGVLFSEIPGALYGPAMQTMCKALEARTDINELVLGEDKLFTSAVIIKS
jgi:hypothetical protein